MEPYAYERVEVLKGPASILYGQAAPGGVFNLVSKRPTDAPLLGWDEIRALSKSGLVEIASHSYDLHHGIHGNPQGNAFAAATARSYDVQSGLYENDADYEQRIRADLA